MGIESHSVDRCGRKVAVLSLISVVTRMSTAKRWNMEQLSSWGRIFRVSVHVIRRRMSRVGNDVFEIVAWSRRRNRTTSRLLLRRHCVALPFFICREKKKKMLGLAEIYIRGYKRIETKLEPRSCRLCDKIDHDLVIDLTAWGIFGEEREDARSLRVFHRS